MSDKRTYSRDEVEEILERALARTTDTGDALDHEDLVAAARDIGLPADEVERAIREADVAKGRRATAAAIEARRRARLLGSFGTYVAVNAMLAVVDYLSGPGWWVQWPLAIWGLGLVFSTIAALRSPSDAEVDRELELRAREAERAAKKARKREEKERRKRDVDRASREFEAAVEEGVGLLLSAAAKHLDHVATEAIKENRRGARRPPPVRVEVEVREPAAEPADAARRERDARRRAH